MGLQFPFLPLSILYFFQIGEMIPKRKPGRPRRVEFAAEASDGREKGGYETEVSELSNLLFRR